MQVSIAGHLVNLARLRDHLPDIPLWMLARSLGRIPRFGGHTHTPVSVLAHSLHCGLMAERDNLPDAQVKAALMHDITEALVGCDVPAPIKPGTLRATEQILWPTTFQHYTGEEPAAFDTRVHEVDMRARCAEATFFKGVQNIPEAEERDVSAVRLCADAWNFTATATKQTLWRRFADLVKNYDRESNSCIKAAAAYPPKKTRHPEHF